MGRKNYRGCLDFSSGGGRSRIGCEPVASCTRHPSTREETIEIVAIDTHLLLKRPRKRENTKESFGLGTFCRQSSSTVWRGARYAPFHWHQLTLSGHRGHRPSHVACAQAGHEKLHR